MRTADGRGLQQVLEAIQVAGSLPLEQPGHQRLQDSGRAEQAALHHLGEPAAGRAARLHQPRAVQLLLPVVGAPLQQAPGLDR